MVFLHSYVESFLTYTSRTWKSVFSAVTSSLELGNDHTAAIQRFLGDPEVLQLIASPYDAYAEPSAQTKSAFERKTSAINVTPSSTMLYDVKQIKDDALWLSNVAKIGEVAALRVVVEECQSRAAAQLLGPFSEDELASIRDAAGDTKYSSSIPVGLVSRGPDAQDIQKEFDKTDSRQKRILRIYLAERRYHLKCAERIIYSFILNHGGAAEENRSWLSRSAEDLESTPLRSGDGGQFLLRCICAIETNMKNLM